MKFPFGQIFIMFVRSSCFEFVVYVLVLNAKCLVALISFDLPRTTCQVAFKRIRTISVSFR